MDSSKEVESQVANTQEVKNWLQELVEIPILGSILALFLGLGVPIGGSHLILYYLWIPEENPIVDPILFIAVTIWNIFLVKKMNVVFTLPLIPIPLWIFGIAMLVWNAIES